MSHTLNHSPASNTWWSRRWQMLLKQLGLEVSAESVRGSRVKRMEVLRGQIQAQVQDRELGAAAVAISFPVLDDALWERVIDALSRQALYAAQLLAGNMPPEIEQIFLEAGAALLPQSLSEIHHSCNVCAPAGGKLCRPLAAVYWQLGEMLAEDPWLLLRLRGRERQQVLAGIHERRNVGAEPPAQPSSTLTQVADTQMAAFYTPAPAQLLLDADDVPALDAQVNDFWGRRKVLEDIHYHLARPVVELALLRRLGPPTPTPDGQEAYSQLQTVYRRVTDRVWALAFEPDADDEHGED